VYPTKRTEPFAEYVSESDLEWGLRDAIFQGGKLCKDPSTTNAVRSNINATAIKFKLYF
jgi:hypothetical protein